MASILAHDREMASVGITTVFDAIRVGSIQSSMNKRLHKKYARDVANEIAELRTQGVLKIRHHIHLRAETCSETLMEELDEFGVQDRVGIVSLMDHTPGQRQFADEAKFETYVRGKYNPPESDFVGYVDFLKNLRARLGERHENAVVAAAARFGAVLASHDDTTFKQVEQSGRHGVRLAEFPTTVEAARACHTMGIVNILGGPNLVRGGCIQAMSRRSIWPISTFWTSSHQIMCPHLCYSARCSWGSIGGIWRGDWQPSPQPPRKW